MDDFVSLIHSIRFGIVSTILSHSSGFSITCGIQGCLHTYTNYTSWVKHVHSKHSLTSSTTTELHSEDDDDFVAMEINEFNEIESNTTEIQIQLQIT